MKANERERFERYAKDMDWDIARSEDGYYVSAEMNDRWALWMGCIEFDWEINPVGSEAAAVPSDVTPGPWMVGVLDRGHGRESYAVCTLDGKPVEPTLANVTLMAGAAAVPARQDAPSNYDPNAHDDDCPLCQLEANQVAKQDRRRFEEWLKSAANLSDRGFANVTAKDEKGEYKWPDIRLAHHAWVYATNQSPKGEV